MIEYNESMRRMTMFDAQCDLAALVYDETDDPDRVLLNFCSELARGGYRPVGLVQEGHCQGGGSSLSALLIQTGERISLVQDLGACASGCRLDVDQLLMAGSRVVTAIDHRADLVVVNRFGRLEQAGKGLSFLIELAMSAGVPAIIAVPSHRFQDWLRYSQGMSVKLNCDHAALWRWWWSLSHRPEPRVNLSATEMRA